jgi:rfaE bifunctional protein kinase chain/domain
MTPYQPNNIETEKIEKSLEKLKDLSVLVIGDIILDHYVFATMKGRAIKDPILSVKYNRKELYAGGIIAVTNHLADFVKKIKLVTLVGDYDSQIDFINSSLSSNTELKAFVKPNSPTTVKKRMINNYNNNKLFKIEYINDEPIDDELTNEILQFLEDQISNYDLVVVGDFGHGFINDRIRRKLEEKAKYLAVNTQSNSSNMGYNYFKLYNKFNFLSINEDELRLPLSMRFENINNSISKAKELYPSSDFLVTVGKKGCLYVNNEGIFKGPILTQSVKDTVGAGDAVFAISSLFNYLKTDAELIPFIANCAGGIAANIMGNKESLTKQKLMSFIKEYKKDFEEVEIKDYFNSVNKALNCVDKGNVTLFVKKLLETYHKQGTIYVFGNGGSAATASHFCGDLIKGVSYGLEKRFKVVCLNDNIPSLMAIANDISYDDIFIEQLKNFLEDKDLVIGISGSGNSTNIVKALEYAKNKGVKTSAICGYKGGKIKEIADISVHAEIDDMEVTEDIHNLIMVHCVKRVLTKELNNTNLGEEYLKRTS